MMTSGLLGTPRRSYQFDGRASSRDRSSEVGQKESGDCGRHTGHACIHPPPLACQIVAVHFKATRPFSHSGVEGGPYGTLGMAETEEAGNYNLE